MSQRSKSSSRGLATIFTRFCTTTNIIEHTNKYIRKLRKNYSREKDASDTNTEEIKAHSYIKVICGRKDLSPDNGN